MVKLGVIHRVDYPTEWVNSMVITQKPNGDLRICLDPKDLNRNILREHYQLPTVGDSDGDNVTLITHSGVCSSSLGKLSPCQEPGPELNQACRSVTGCLKSTNVEMLLSDYMWN